MDLSRISTSQADLAHYPAFRDSGALLGSADRIAFAMKAFPVSICTITFEAATGCYGFATRFKGKPPHDRMGTFESIENVLAWVDPQQERLWEPASDADESKVMLSRAYKPGSVPWRCENLPARSAQESTF
jgi:hypothetical protein